MVFIMVYAGDKLKEIVFPLGGIGTGSIGLAGNGSLVDWEIFNRPNKGSINNYCCFAIKAEYPDGKVISKILQGDWNKELSGTYSKTTFSGFGFGPAAGRMCGFPHFRKVKFDGKFPIATLTFEDEGFPAKVILKAFNPFIPLDADNSSIPAAFFDVEVRSYLDDVKFTIVFSASNPFETSQNKKIENEKYTAIQLSHFGKVQSEQDYGDMTIAVDDKNGVYQEYWYRGRWQDRLTTFWHDFTSGPLVNRTYNNAWNKDACSVGSMATIDKNKKHQFRFVLSWNIPNNYNYWEPCKDAEGNDVSWKNYYATLFKDSTETCFYAFERWNDLYKRTQQFWKSLHTSTLDKIVIEAISSTLSVLKSPTVLRLEDGRFYGWEGVHELAGSCEGTCTHVWSYAYALCFLFPELERSLRDTEIQYNTADDGKMQFRTKLPIGRNRGDWHPCLDGQMATVFKIYRDWKITGNNEWLQNNWNEIKRILEFAWSEQNTYEWDRDHDGVLEGRQHHTLDMELFGPSSWLQGMYLAALKAASEMALFLGDIEKQQEYAQLFEQGYQWTKENLFNGEYFYHKVDLKHKEYVMHFDCPDYWNEEKMQLKYQIGEGCEIDQMLGQWHANIIGLGDIFDKEQRQIALASMMKYNFKTSMRDFANPWRIFALNDESGSVMCDYPKEENKPIIPIPYCEECMTGFEYSFAGLLISEGFIEEGLKVIRAVRDRYDGSKRNPWNEIECGSNYARPMASFALLPIFSGMQFDLPNHHIGFAPIVSGDFKCLWSLGTGWGDFVKTDNEYKVIIHAGNLTLDTFSLEKGVSIGTMYIDSVAVAFTQNGEHISFDKHTAYKELRFEVIS